MFNRIFRFFWRRLKALFKMGTDPKIVILLKNLMRNDCQTAKKTIAKQQVILAYNTCLLYFQLFRLAFKKKNEINVALQVFLVDLRWKSIKILSFLNKEVIIVRAGIDKKIVSLAESFLLFCRDKSTYQMFFHNVHSLEIPFLGIKLFLTPTCNISIYDTFWKNITWGY